MMTNIIEGEEPDMPKVLEDVWQTECHIITPVSLPVKDNNVRTTKSFTDTANHVPEYEVVIAELKTEPIDFTLEGKEAIIEKNQEAPKFDGIQQESHYWHLRLKHNSKARMEWMINSGWLPNI